MTDIQRPPRTYSHWRKVTTAGLFGLGTIGTGIGFAGLIIAVIFLFFNLLVGLLTFVVVVAFVLVMVTRDKHGRNIIPRVSTRVAWSAHQASGAHLYRSGPLGRTKWGTASLPGLLARSELYEYTDIHDRPFALLRVPTTDHYTVVFVTEPDGASLVDQSTVDMWVANWGGWLANLGDEDGIVAASVTVETAPDTGSRLKHVVNARLDPSAPPFALATMNEVVEVAPLGAATVKAYVGLTFRGTVGESGKKSRPLEVGSEIMSRIPGLTLELQNTGAGSVTPLSAQGLCEMVRIAYDPGAAAGIEEAHAEGETPYLPWPDIGPTGTEAGWDWYRHDSGLSVTWEMTEAPRGIVQSGILTRLLAPHKNIARKRVTWLYRPIDAGSAAAIVEADAKAAAFLNRATDRPTARGIASAAAAHRTANEEAAGAGLVNFGMLVTATVTDDTRLKAAKAAISSLSATARLRLRIVHGSQDSAFAAALPLGLIIPAHMTLPSEVKAKL